MDFLELVRNRYSARSFSDQKIEKEKLDIILETARIAPSAHNNQPSRLLILDSKEDMAKLATAAWVYDAPMAIIVCADTRVVWKRKYDQMQTIDIDTTITAAHIMFAAEHLGINTCWVTYFEPTIVRDCFCIPEHLIPVNIILLGYANGERPSIERFNEQRLKLEEIVTYHSF